jgi:hypothetical protein
MRRKAWNLPWSEYDEERVRMGGKDLDTRHQKKKQINLTHSKRAKQR